MKKLIASLLLGIGTLCAQTSEGSPVSQVDTPPPAPVFFLYFYDGSNNVTSICSALQIQPVITTFKISDTTLTNIVVASNVATATAPNNKLYANIRIAVAGSATTALNGNYTVTSQTTNTLVFTTSGVSDGTYTDAGLSIQTRQPRTSDAKWAIKLFPNSGGLIQNIHWALPDPLVAPSSKPPMTAKCDDRGNY